MGKILKKLILVTSPPACGKTYISKKLASALEHVVYLDKDTLITLSKQIFLVANEEYNRSSDFFEKYIRNEEYYCVLDLAFEAIQYEDLVLINAPFTREIRDIEYMHNLEKKLEDMGGELVVIWVKTSPEVCKERMIARNSDRDTWKLANWDEYIKRCNFTEPVGIKNFIVFNNNSDEEFASSMDRIVKYLQDK